MGNYGGYGSMNMEKSFRDCSISAGGGTSSTFFDMNEEQTFMEQRGEDHQEIETLPLFPMHGEDIFGNMKTISEGGGGYNGGSRIFLELILNSYGSTLFSREGVFSAREETMLEKFSEAADSA
ncbi:hypothetical protein RchiOBHm_Chr4g0388561 [Rosa chinensis]|uniref:Uncharacterized protein n=1 Tax=Rosa chinensis TaxID=74649 RepID=A0A2P6QPT8_ROSCH|nr:hypothetical protein RchiOBHm_Chr4g0388561 [Rosa chinensis]